MSKPYSKAIILFVLLIFSAAYSVTGSGQKAQTGLQKGMGFESSVGKSTDAQKLEGADGLLQFTAGGHVLGFQKSKMFVVSVDHALSVEFVKARPVSPTEEKSFEPKASQQAAQPLSRIAYRHLWDGVTLIYERHRSGVVKSTYQIQPTEIGASNPVDQIRLRYKVPVKIDDDGNLILSFARGEMRESRPVAWQEIKGKRALVDVTYRLIGEQEVGFKAGSYDPRYQLVIDPVLSWNTFLGGGNDAGSAIAVDTSGNVYVVGTSRGTWGTPVRPYTGDSDAFVAKLDGNGALQWNTFMGSAGHDWGYAIAVDGSGNVYVAGSSSNTWGSPLLPWYGLYYNAFVAKLNGSGALQWNTFLAQSEDGGGYGIAVDASGNARPFILVALHTGLRYGEIKGLKWKNISFEKALIKVENTKSKKARFIPINSRLLDVLKNLKVEGGDGEDVFKVKDVHKAFGSACKRARIEGLTFHDLRRTFGTRLIERGVDIVTISKLYGHSSVLVTQRYLHPRDTLSREAVELLAKDEAKPAESAESLAQIGHKKNQGFLAHFPNRSFSMN